MLQDRNRIFAKPMVPSRRNWPLREREGSTEVEGQAICVSGDAAASPVRPDPSLPPGPRGTWARLECTYQVDVERLGGDGSFRPRLQLAPKADWLI
jgi:hypothetical protein